MGDKLYQKKKMKSKEDFARKTKTRKEHKLVLIVCEDSKSSADYFKFLRRKYREVVITVAGKECGSAPISVIDYAIETAKNTTPKFDKIYCVIDRDSHETFEKAMDKANSQKKNQINVAYSVPCFEFWLLLHFCNSSKPFLTSKGRSAAGVALSDLKQQLPSYDKGNLTLESLNILYSKLDNAMKNSKSIREEHNKHKKDKYPNPITYVDELISYLNRCEEP